MSEENTETPGTDGKKKKTGPAITVVRSDETTPPDITAPLEPPPDVAASPEAPKRRGRPPGTGNRKPRSRPASAPVMETSSFRVRAVLKFLSVDPNGTRTYFDRAVSSTGTTAKEAADAVSAKLSKIHEAWEKVYLR